MEGIAYVLLYLLKGKLPWQGLTAKTKKEKYDRIRDVKVSISIEDLCKDLPIEFCDYLKYCHKLSFDERPDYAYVKKLFKNLFMKKGYNCDYIYDWVLSKSPSKNSIGKSLIMHTNGNFDINKTFERNTKVESKRHQSPTKEETKKLIKKSEPERKRYPIKIIKDIGMINMSSQLTKWSTVRSRTNTANKGFRKEYIKVAGGPAIKYTTPNKV